MKKIATIGAAVGLIGVSSLFSVGEEKYRQDTIGIYTDLNDEAYENVKSMADHDEKFRIIKGINGNCKSFGFKQLAHQHPPTASYPYLEMTYELEDRKCIHTIADHNVRGKHHITIRNDGLTFDKRTNAFDWEGLPLGWKQFFALEIEGLDAKQLSLSNDQLQSILDIEVLSYDFDPSQGLEKISTLAPLKFLKNLKSIQLSGHDLAFLQFDDFLELNQLHTIKLNANSISGIEPGTFAKLFNLKHLSLSANGLTYLNPRIFGDVHQILHIDFSDNKISQIHKSTFANMHSLKVVDFKGNAINEIGDNAFSVHASDLVIDLGGQLGEEAKQEALKLQVHLTAKVIF